jgi:hypothetical protein
MQRGQNCINSHNRLQDRHDYMHKLYQLYHVFTIEETQIWPMRGMNLYSYNLFPATIL